ARALRAARRGPRGSRAAMGRADARSPDVRRADTGYRSAPRPARRGASSPCLRCGGARGRDLLRPLDADLVEAPQAVVPRGPPARRPLFVEDLDELSTHAVER